METEVSKQVSYVRIMCDGGLMSFLRATPSRYLSIDANGRNYRLRAQDGVFGLRSFGGPSPLYDLIVPEFCGLTEEEDTGSDRVFVSVFAPQQKSLKDLSAPEKAERMRSELDQLRKHRLRFPHCNRLSQYQWNMVRELNKHYADQVRFEVVDEVGANVTQIAAGDSLFVVMRIRGLLAGGPWPLGVVTALQLPYK